MPGDPKECREHARRCAELAKVATTPEARDQFLSLQMSWIRLAADLDNAEALIDAMNEMDGSCRPSPLCQCCYLAELARSSTSASVELSCWRSGARFTYPGLSGANQILINDLAKSCVLTWGRSPHMCG